MLQGSQGEQAVAPGLAVGVDVGVVQDLAEDRRRLHHAPDDSQEPPLTLGRAAALLAAEALYREGLHTGNRTLLTRARDAFLEARDLNQGSWRAPWALARMGDCAQALGLKAEAIQLRQEAAWEYGQIGLGAGPPPEGTAGIQALVAWRTEALQKLGGP